MTGWGVALAVAAFVGCLVAPVLVGWAANAWCTRRRLARCRAAELRRRVDEVRHRNQQADPGPAEPYLVRLGVPGRVAS